MGGYFGARLAELLAQIVFVRPCLGPQREDFRATNGACESVLCKEWAEGELHGNLVCYVVVLQMGVPKNRETPLLVMFVEKSTFKQPVFWFPDVGQAQPCIFSVAVESLS